VIVRLGKELRVDAAILQHTLEIIDSFHDLPNQSQASARHRHSLSSF
jgi:hypothetical protein